MQTSTPHITTAFSSTTLVRSVVEILRADEADDGIDEKRRPATGEAVVSRLERELITTAVRIGRERRALAGLEVHDVRPGRDRKSTRLNSSHRCISYAVF